jgi:hypothetical protein
MVLRLYPSITALREPITANVVAEIASPNTTYGQISEPTTPFIDTSTISPAPPPPLPFRDPPGPKQNLIVESPLQRFDDPKPFSKVDLVRSQPQDANPERTLPPNIIRTMGPPADLAKFYTLERPLDLMRHKGDKYWNKLQFSGFYEQRQEEIDNVPFYVELHGYQRGNPNPSGIKGTIISNQIYELPNKEDFPIGNGNFTQATTKETIVLRANPSDF